MVFSAVMFWAPEGGGYFHQNAGFQLTLKTPPHIAPVWYFTPFYSILRAVTSRCSASMPSSGVWSPWALRL
jgi:ubiquinol-cytochrome c reductase cytochrome b subunit